MPQPNPPSPHPGFSYPFSTRVIKLQELPPFSPGLPTSFSPSEKVAAYLHLTLDSITCASYPVCLLLPSLISLSQLLNTPQTEIRSALKTLRLEGFDIFVPGLYGHISVWPKPQPPSDG